MQLRRLLYLGNAFPPGVSALFPEVQPAGHLIETNLIHSLRSRFDIRSVGLSSVNVNRLPRPLPSSPGLDNALNLLDRKPALWNWLRSSWRLQSACRQWRREGWRPDLIVVCNFTSVYNAFIRRLARRKHRPQLVLYLADSTLLDVPLPRLKRWRYQLKPFKWLDDDMAGLYDACVAVSAETEPRFTAGKIPWLWLPNGIDPARLRRNAAGPESGPIVFGYFGHAGEHTGIHHLLRLFTATPRPARLKVCCFGKMRGQLASRFADLPNVSFHGPFDPEGCVEFGTGCDVLINPRLKAPGNRNNFPSKVFEYALTGRAVLSSQLSGADKVLGPAAYYFDANHYSASLGQMLEVLASTPRTELRRRGAGLQNHLLAEYQWETQGRRLASFLQDLLRRTQASERPDLVHEERVDSLASSGVALGLGNGADLGSPSASSSYNLRDLR
jgi:glycosyltransferase involved in cell wall biosynthesis